MRQKSYLPQSRAVLLLFLLPQDLRGGLGLMEQLTLIEDEQITPRSGAKKYKENAMIVNAIMAHHGDVEPKTIEAVLIQAADAISGARPGARRETGTNYVKRLERLEAIASSFNGVEKSYAIQAGREVRVMVKPDQVDDAQALFLAKDIAKKIEAELEYPGQIKVNVIREFRCVEYAK